MKANPVVVERLRGFINKVQEETNREWSEKYNILTPPLITVSEGGKYFSIWKTEFTDSGRGSIHSFIDKQNGDIYKPATYRAPAKHVRGNIFDENFSWGKGVNIYGGTYIR